MGHRGQPASCGGIGALEQPSTGRSAANLGPGGALEGQSRRRNANVTLLRMARDPFVCTEVEVVPETGARTRWRLQFPLLSLDGQIDAEDQIWYIAGSSLETRPPGTAAGTRSRQSRHFKSSGSAAEVIGTVRYSLTIT